MLLRIKNYFKYRLPRLYRYVRDLLFPIYVKLRSRNLKKFLHYVKDINFNGVKYKLVLRAENGFVDEEIYWKGVYEEEVMNELKSIIENNKNNSTCVFLDIGSNIGQELIFVASMGIKSYGFEPLINLYDQIKESIEINNLKNIAHIYNFALGDKNEELILKSPVINVGGSSLVRNESNTVGEIREQKIIVKNGDSIFPKIINEINLETHTSPLAPLPKRGEVFGFNPSPGEGAEGGRGLKLIIKIDVEGFEYEVIRGLIETIKIYKPIIILEYSPAFYIKNSAMGDRSQMGIELLKLLVEEKYIMEIIDIGEYKNKIYKGQEIINWGHNFKGEQANLLLYKV